MHPPTPPTPPLPPAATQTGRRNIASAKFKIKNEIQTARDEVEDARDKEEQADGDYEKQEDAREHREKCEKFLRMKEREFEKILGG